MLIRQKIAKERYIGMKAKSITIEQLLADGQQDCKLMLMTKEEGKNPVFLTLDVSNNYGLNSLNAVAGLQMLVNKEDTYRLQLVYTGEDISIPVLILAKVSLDEDGQEIINSVMECDMSPVYEQVWDFFKDKGKSCP